MTPGVANLDPRGRVARIYVGDLKTFLYTDYINCEPHGFREVLFFIIIIFIYNFGLMGPGTRCFPYQYVQLQTYESRTLFLMTSLQYYCILGLAEIKTLHP